MRELLRRKSIAETIGVSTTDQRGDSITHQHRQQDNDTNTTWKRCMVPKLN